MIGIPKMHSRGVIAMPVIWALCIFLSSLPVATAIRQVRHDRHFQPDYVLRITEDTVPIACRTRFSALVNGMLDLYSIYFEY